MTTPRRFLRTLNTHPVAAPEIAHLRAQGRNVLHPRFVPLHLLGIAAGIAAAIPAWYTITQDDTRLLIAIAVLVFAVQIAASLRTALVAAHALSREFAPERWAALTTGECHARQIVIGKWWAAVRTTWRPHIYAAVLRVGVALGVAQHVYFSSAYDTCTPATDRLMCYPEFFSAFQADLGSFQRGLASFRPVLEDPRLGLYKIALALGLALAGSLVMVSLAAALGLLGAAVARARHVAPRFMTIVLYLMTLGVGVGLLVERSMQLDSALGGFYWRIRPVLLPIIDLAATWSLALLMDGGTLLSASVLRLYEPSAFNTARTSTFAGIGVVFSLLVLGLLLRAAQWGLVRQGVSPAPFRSLADLLVGWRKNPLIDFHRRKSARLRAAQNPWRRVGWWVAFAVGLVIAWSPRWFPVHDRTPLRLWILAGFIVSVQMFGMARTLFLATRTMQRTLASQTWEVIQLTGLNSRQLIIGQWWIVIRETWGYHALAAILKLGFAEGLYQYLLTTPIGWGLPPVGWTDLERLTAHLSMNFVGPRNDWYLDIRPMYWDSLIGGSRYFKAAALLLSCGLAEVALLSAIGLLGALVVPRYSALQTAFSVFYRAACVALALTVVWFSVDWAHYRDQTYPNPSIERAEEQNWFRTVDTLRLSISTVVDTGLGSLVLFKLGSTSATLRKTVGLLLGLGLYALLTLITLRAAERLAIRRGALPPPN